MVEWTHGRHYHTSKQSRDIKKKTAETMPVRTSFFHDLVSAGRGLLEPRLSVERKFSVHHAGSSHPPTLHSTTEKIVETDPAQIPILAADTAVSDDEEEMT